MLIIAHHQHLVTQWTYQPIFTTTNRVPCYQLKSNNYWDHASDHGTGSWPQTWRTKCTSRIRRVRSVQLAGIIFYVPYFHSLATLWSPHSQHPDLSVHMHNHHISKWPSISKSRYHPLDLPTWNGLEMDSYVIDMSVEQQGKVTSPAWAGALPLFDSNLTIQQYPRREDPLKIHRLLLSKSVLVIVTTTGTCSWNCY